MTVKENTVPLQQSKITKEEMFIEDKLVNGQQHQGSTSNLIKGQSLSSLQPKG